MPRDSEVYHTQRVSAEPLPLPASSESVPPASGNTQSVLEPTQVLNQSASPPDVAVQARLVNLDSRDVYELGGCTPDVLLGRHPSSRVLISDQNVSSRHCCVYRDKYTYNVKDTSSNGTFVNNNRLNRDEIRRLKSGDIISLILPDHPKYSFVFVEAPSTQQAVFARPLQPEADTPRKRPQLIVASTEGVGAGGDELQDGGSFESRFQVVRSIGKGNFSEVFLCVERSTGSLLAAKLVDTAKTELFTKRAKSSSIDIQSECRLLAAVSHPNIVSFVAMYRQEAKLYIVTEFMEGGDLLTRLIDRGRFDEINAKKIFRQIAAGLRYLHEDKNITIRDLKPENILLNKDASVAKLADFGLARELKEAAGEGAPRTYCGTPHYFAPEMFKLQRHEVKSYGKEVDIWSLGVVLYVLLSARPPFSDEDLALQVERGAYDFDCPEFHGVSDSAKDLVSKCMQIDPNKRLTVAQVLDHPWLAAPVVGSGGIGALKRPLEAETEESGVSRKRARLSEEVEPQQAEVNKENADN